MPYTNPHAMLPRQRRVSATRRLRALAWMGYSPRRVAALYDVDPDVLADFIEHPKRNTCDVDTWYAVAVAFDDLEMRFGPDQNWREFAQRCGWPPPLAWDEDTIDAPQGKADLGEGSKRRGDLGPDHAVLWRRLNGDHDVPMRPADIRAVVRHLHAHGQDDRTIADRIGTTIDAVQSIRYRLGLPLVHDPLRIPHGQGPRARRRAAA